MPRSKVWIGFRIPGRDTWATYSGFHYDDQAKVIPFPEFQEIKTCEDLKRNLKSLVKKYPYLDQSPTACYWDFDGEEPGVFFRDQQDCVVWCVDNKTGEVFVPSQDKDVEEYAVATSLPEFLTRIALENEIWHFSCFLKPKNQKISEAAKTYMAHYVNAKDEEKDGETPEQPPKYVFQEEEA